MTTVRFQWRPPAAGELDHERLWLGVGAAGGVMVAAGWLAGLRAPPCLFHLVTGYPCPGCGSTRALRQLVHGNLGGAFAFNPLTTLAVFAAAVWALYAAGVLLKRWPRLRVQGIGRPWAVGLRGAVFAAVALNWWWVLAHHW